MAEINKDNLFTNQLFVSEAESEHSSESIEWYVINDLPSDLAAIRNGELTYVELANRHRALIEGIQPEFYENLTKDEAATLQLDLGFMMGSYLPDNNFSLCPGAILELAKLQSERHGLFPYMDYELIIDVNSREFEKTGRMRTFLDSDQASAERDFYYGHYLSEPFVKDAAFKLDEIVKFHGNNNIDTNANLAIASESMQEFADYVSKYAKLSRDAFSSFRPYLASYPDGTRNASGAFMPSVQLAELRLHKPSEEHLVFLDESMPYFPEWSRNLIDEWTRDSLEGGNIMDLIESGAIEVSDERKQLLSSFVEYFYRFRVMHNAITRQQIGEAFEGRNMPKTRKQYMDFGEPDIMAEGEKGTAGFDIVNILGGAASRMARLSERVKDITVKE